MGRRHQQDVRRSTFPRPGSARPGDPDLDRSRWRRRSAPSLSPGKSSASSPTSTYPSFSSRKARRGLRPVPAAPLAVRARGRVDPHAQGSGGPGVGRSAHARSSDSGRGRARRPRSGGARLHDHGPARHVVSVGDQQPILCVAVHGLRHAGDPARDGGCLRRDVVGRRTAHDRVRDPHGPWRARARCRDDADGTVAQTDRDRGPLGIAGGFGLSRALNSMFWRITTVDPLVMAGISAVMLAVALLAAWVPVNRVTRIDPQSALRQS